MGRRDDEVVYRGLTQRQLDAQYEQTTAVPEAAAYRKRWSLASAELRARLTPRTCSYGHSAAETVDVFTAQAGGTLHMHLHGGAWRALSKDEASFAVSGLGADGTTVAVPDFALAPVVHLREMVAQVRRAFLWLRANAGDELGATLPVAVSGHSSGAHLAACLLDREWWRAAGLRPEDFAGVVLASGCYDLAPVRLSARNDYLALDKEDVCRLSPLARLPDHLPPVALFWGGRELDEFRRQSCDMAAAVAARRPDAAVSELPGLNHFDVYDAFEAPDSPVCRAARALRASGASEATTAVERTHP